MIAYGYIKGLIKRVSVSKNTAFYRQLFLKSFKQEEIVSSKVGSKHLVMVLQSGS